MGTPDALDVAGWYGVCGTALRCPYRPSRCAPACARSCGLLSATGRATFGLRQMERPGGVGRSGASALDPLTTATEAGSTRSSATAPEVGIAAPSAVGGFGRSSLCAQQSRFDERSFYTIILQRQLPDLGVEDLEIWRVRRGLCRTAKHIDGPRQQMLLPFRDLGGMHAKLCRQLRQRLIAFDRGEGHLSLEGRPVIASRSLHRLAPLVRPLSGASIKQGYHLAHCPNFWAPSAGSPIRTKDRILK